ncbi:60S acidic P0 family protein [Klebsormidium nitens]|uniref:Ribosome assembly factor mrt4 n=1 Tax=Klebsormidium nitens TaxID=105231 RepID=A0A1Y1HSH3_KLENI|nr:60S acidic P0 family protein [Klebsormidium nitens]|eukprot:GAQ80129.1 60S acidic P0 family protein [Klebsormidium nitens]
MPKSKRNKVVTLSQTKKKGREQKEGVINKVRACFDEYSSMYVFRYENMRNTKLKELRDRLASSSRFFLGSNKVLQVALGKTDAEEYRDGAHKAAELVSGNRGLFFTNLSKDEVMKLFEDYEELDYARTGTKATKTVELPEGPLEMFTHDQEPFLRKQGMPTKLNRGVVELVSDFTVCKEGAPLAPEAARILRLLGEQLAAFRITPIALWTSDSFELLVSEEEAAPGAQDDEGEMEEVETIDM